MSFFIYAYIILGSKLYRGFSSSSYNRSNVWLTDAYNPVLDPVRFMIVHVFLLLIQFHDRKVAVHIPGWKRVAFMHVSLKISQIPVKASQLFSDQ